MNTPLAILEMTAPDDALEDIKQLLADELVFWEDDPADMGAVNLLDVDNRGIYLTVYLDAEDYELTLLWEETYAR